VTYILSTIVTTAVWYVSTTECFVIKVYLRVLRFLCFVF